MIVKHQIELQKIKEIGFFEIVKYKYKTNSNKKKEYI